MNIFGYTWLHINLSNCRNICFDKMTRVEFFQFFSCLQHQRVRILVHGYVFWLMYRQVRQHCAVPCLLSGYLLKHHWQLNISHSSGISNVNGGQKASHGNISELELDILKPLLSSMGWVKCCFIINADIVRLPKMDQLLWQVFGISDFFANIIYKRIVLDLKVTALRC